MGQILSRPHLLSEAKYLPPLLTMKLFLLFNLSVTVMGAVTGPVTGNLRSFKKRGNSGGSSGCSFTLLSSGSFSCPAGQLPDGQIRLNGTEDTASFYLQAGGGFTDHNGYGCIVTGKLKELSGLSRWHAFYRPHIQVHSGASQADHAI